MSDFIRTNDGLIQFDGPVSIATLWRVAEHVYAESLYHAPLTRPDDAAAYVASRIGLSESEQFMVIFLDTRHRVLAADILFYGTIDGTSVHPREVVKQALRRNSAAVILGHNHPSGVVDPSAADIAVTRRLRESLALVDIRVLDHIIVAGTTTCSMAARGLV